MTISKINKLNDKIKILLINPPITTQGSDSPKNFFVPLGLAYIASVLESEGYEPSIFDALAGDTENGNGFVRKGLSKNAIQNYLIEKSPDVVGITSMFTAYSQDAHDVASIVKEINPNILVVFGGAHASANYDMVLEDENVDMVISGEGEITFLEIIKAFEKGQEITRIAGTIVKNEGKILFNPERPYISNIDTIPFPSRHLLQMETYLKASDSPYQMRKPATSMITSRGCPGHCVYCSINSVWGRKWRARSPENVVDEIGFLIKNYGIHEISFMDDSIGTDKKRLEAICDEIIKRKIDIRWTTPNGIAHWTLDNRILEKMKNAGCYRITFGIESGHLEIRKFLGKPYPLAQAKELLTYANKIGMWTICTNILGFPYETYEQMQHTINFAIASGTDFALFYPLTPFRGTEVYKIFEKEKLLPKNIEKNREWFITEKTRCNKFHSEKALAKINKQAYRKFLLNRFVKVLLNPIIISRKIHSWEDLAYVVRLARQFLIIGLKIIRPGGMGAKLLYGVRNKKS